MHKLDFAFYLTSDICGVLILWSEDTYLGLLKQSQGLQSATCVLDSRLLLKEAQKQDGGLVAGILF